MYYVWEQNRPRSWAQSLICFSLCPEWNAGYVYYLRGYYSNCKFARCGTCVSYQKYECTMWGYSQTSWANFLGWYESLPLPLVVIVLHAWWNQICSIHLGLESLYELGGQNTVKCYYHYCMIWDFSPTWVVWDFLCEIYVDFGISNLTSHFLGYGSHSGLCGISNI